MHKYVHMRHKCVCARFDTIHIYARAHFCLVHLCILTDLCQYVLVVHFSVMNPSFKFHKDLIFCCRDICKIELCLSFFASTWAFRFLSVFCLGTRIRHLFKNPSSTEPSKLEFGMQPTLFILLNWSKKAYFEPYFNQFWGEIWPFLPNLEENQ